MDLPSIVLIFNCLKVGLKTELPEIKWKMDERSNVSGTCPHIAPLKLMHYRVASARVGFINGSDCTDRRPALIPVDEHTQITPSLLYASPRSMNYMAEKMSSYTYDSAHSCTFSGDVGFIENTSSS